MSLVRNPLFMSTSSEKPCILTVSFASDPSASLGVQLINLDKGETAEMFSPGYACVGKLLDGETIAKCCGVKVGDVLVAINGEGYRRFKSQYPVKDLENVTQSLKEDKHEAVALNNLEYGKTLVLPTGQNYTTLLNRIKQVKKEAPDSLSLVFERYTWDSQCHAFERFLKARDNNIPLAMKMQQDHETWRDATFPLDLTQPDLQSLLRAKVVSEIDVRHDSLPPTVYVNFAKLLELEQSPESVVQAFVIYTETLLKRTDDPRHPKASQFIDLTGVSIKSMRTDVLKRVYATFEPNYPETLYRMVLYPVSRAVASATNVMLSFVNENTRAKFVITDDLQKVCQELGWDKAEVEECGGVTEFMHKHEKSTGESFIIEDI